MEEKEKSVATAMYNYFLETLKGKETFEGKYHFLKPANGYSFLYIEDGKLIVSGGGVETHAINIDNKMDMLLLTFAYYRVFV